MLTPLVSKANLAKVTNDHSDVTFLAKVSAVGLTYARQSSQGSRSQPEYNTFQSNEEGSVNDLKWWQKAVFYQIYPRSFADGNGDGIGDFQGIIDRLDYLHDLGVDALWLSPHFPSPQYDCGYDISDYTDVAPEYGTLDIFKRFLEGAHQRAIRVILDLVLNHTSHQHPWFVESRSSRDNPKRDWYVWRDGEDGGPPNNWYSGFGGSAWEHDPTTGQYYYHYFLKEQPDLNWRNPEVRQAMWDAVRFWLDMGVDGFRLDAISTIFEDPALPDQTAELSQAELHRAFSAAYPELPSEEKYGGLFEQWELMFEHQLDQPGVHELMQELRTVVDGYSDRVLVGESDEIAYYGDGTNELHLVFNFPLMRTGHLTSAWVRANQEERLAALPPGGWPCNTLGNHDASRVFSRYGDGQNDDALARLHLALMLTLRGTPFLYNGEEIGMTDLLMDDIDQFRDTGAIWLYHFMAEEGMPPSEALAVAATFTRDKCRTPMQWDNALNGGFSPAGVQTWLPVNPNYAQGVNVAEQLGDPGSLLNFYRRLLRVRRQTPALIAGDYVPLHEEAEDYLAFLRRSPLLSSPPTGETEGGRETCLVVLNMSDRAQGLSFSLDANEARLIFSSHTRDGDTDTLSELALAPFEVYIATLD
jgi:alpha-glucosidase